MYETLSPDKPTTLNDLLERNLLPSSEVQTPIGNMRVVLATKEVLLEQPTSASGSWNQAIDLLEKITSNGVVAEYLSHYGEVKGPKEEAVGDPSDDQTSPQLAKVRPVKMVIIDCLLTPNGRPFMVYADLTYEQQQKDSSWQKVERKVHFRPDSATTLVEVRSESGKRYILLNYAWKDGAGGPNKGEASAGSMDHDAEAKVELALREVTEEIGLTSEEIVSAKVREVFADQTVSPGGYTEKMSGYHLTITLSEERIQQLMQALHGADENEFIVNQLIPVELPEIPDRLSPDYLQQLNSAWKRILANTTDLKTKLLITDMQTQEYFQIMMKLAIVDR